MERGRAVRAGAAASPYRDLPREEFDPIVAHAGRRLQHAARPARRADPSRRGQPTAARPARRAADGAHLRRHHSRTMPTTRCCSSPRTRSSARVNEDFAVESLAGDVFQLGNRRYKIHERRARHGAGRGRAGPAAEHPVLAGRGAGPQRRALGRGVAPARRDRAALAPIRPATSAAALADGGAWRSTARRRAVGRLPARRRARAGLPADPATRIVLERFFDEAGGMQLVVHSPYGSRLNRAWGLALRKRFCASSTSRSRRRPPRTTSSSRSPRPQLRAGRRAALPQLQLPRASVLIQACSTRRCSPRAGAG